ncbi:hypothetical protein BH24GEM2_BH24GEM2_02050 [soil metagenome]
MIFLRRTPLFLLLALLACRPEAGEPSAATVGRGTDRAPAPQWQSSPTSDVRLEGADPLRVQTGPHTLIFPATGDSLAPPYTVSATLQKQQGRLHEGYGLVFGGESLAADEPRQSYSYFLVRGDGTYLIKRRDGASTSVVRDWTRHAAVPRDTEEGGQPVTLAVHVAPAEVRFLVNGQQVAAIPAAELRTSGQVGLRVAHDVRLAVSDFRAAPDR